MKSIIKYFRRYENGQPVWTSDILERSPVHLFPETNGDGDYFGWYSWLPSVVSLVLSIVYLATAETGPRAKGTVAALFLLGAVLQFRGSGLVLPVIGLVLQVGLAVYLLLWLRLSS